MYWEPNFFIPSPAFIKEFSPQIVVPWVNQQGEPFYQLEFSQVFHVPSSRITDTGDFNAFKQTMCLNILVYWKHFQKILSFN